MKEKKFIGFDLGAESGRCVVAVLKDNVIALDEVHRFVTHNVKYDYGFYWDVLAIYKEFIEGLKKAAREFGPDFDGISVDTWGVDYVLVDPENRILGFPYHYRDDRTDSVMEEAFKIVTKEEMYGKSGIQFAEYNTVFQLFAEMKKKFCLLEHADNMLLMPDFFNYMLCGVKKSEYSIASTTSLTDPKTRDWHWQLIDLFKFPKKIFPEMVEPGTRLGTLLPSIAKQTGVSEETPVFASAGHDTGSAVVSVPAEKSNWAFLSSGTWSLMGIELDNPLINEEALKYNFTNEGGAEKTTRFLKNILGLWPVQECRRYWLDKGEEYSYSRLTELAAEEGEVNAWVDLNDLRFLKAGDMPVKVISYLEETGQRVKTNPGFIVRVILESLAFTYRFIIKQIEKVADKQIDLLHAIGGGIQNELLTQLTADAINKKVVAGPVEGAIIGNVGVIAVASGAVENISEWRKIVSKSFEVKEYQPADSEYFNSNEREFNKIIKTD